MSETDGFTITQQRIRVRLRCACGNRDDTDVEVPRVECSQECGTSVPMRVDGVELLYDFVAESRTVCEAIGSSVGHMTIMCALREAYEAGRITAKGAE